MRKKDLFDKGNRLQDPKYAQAQDKAALVRMAGLDYFLGTYVDAEKACRRALELDAKFVPAWTQLGTVLHAVHRNGEAERALRRALQLDPINANAWLVLEHLLDEEKRFDEAREANLRGREFRDMFTDLEVAEKAFRRVVKLTPDNEQAWVNLVHVLRELKKDDEAIRVLDDAKKFGSKVAGKFYDSGESLLERRDYEGAEKDYRNALEIDPNFALAQVGLGMAEAGLGKHDEAEKAYRKAIELNRKIPRAWFKLAELLKDLKRFEEAEEAEKAGQKALGSTDSQ
jgi:tetratricopeptide (TPR) repeat protein